MERREERTENRDQVIRQPGNQGSGNKGSGNHQYSFRVSKKERIRGWKVETYKGKPVKK
jgi:hypothetical protein